MKNKAISNFKVKQPKIPVYYIASKNGKITYQSENKQAVMAWKISFGASVWKVSSKVEPLPVKP